MILKVTKTKPVRKMATVLKLYRSICYYYDDGYYISKICLIDCAKFWDIWISIMEYIKKILTIPPIMT